MKNALYLTYTWNDINASRSQNLSEYERKLHLKYQWFQFLIYSAN